MTVPQRYPFLMAIVLLGVIAAGAILIARARVEARNNTVEVILDAEAWRELALREGRPPAEVLAGLRARGATSVALYEATLRRLREQGLAHYVGGAELQAAARGLVAGSPAWASGLGQSARPEALYVVVDPSLTAWVEAGFRGILGARRVRRIGSVIEVIGTREDLEEVGLGFLPAEAAAYRDAGFHLVLRARNYRGLTPEGLASKFRRYATLGSGQTMVFESAEVIGYVRLLDRTADHMRRLQIRFGRIEVFSARRRQRGEDTLTAGLRPAVIRLFSVTPEELTVLPPPAAASKYVRSAKERNIRLLYLRPLMSTGAGQDALKVNEDFVHSIVRRLREAGFRVGRAAPLQPVHLPIPLLMLSIVGGLAMGAILLGELAQATGRRAREAQLLVLVAAGAVLTLLIWVAGPFTLWRRIVALGVAIAGATLAVVIPLRSTDRSGADRSGRGDATFRAVWTLVEATLISGAAAVLVAAILTSWSFMMAVDIFMGVKLAHALPPLIAAALLIGKHSLARPGLVARDVWTWLERPLRMQYAVIGIVALAGAFVLLGRSGNFGLPLLGAEERMRAILEELFAARPRTKEFLIGHPALMLAGACAALGLRRWMVALAAVGAVGQAGIINTFSHIHSPLELGLQRALNAVVLGFLLGLIVVLVLQWTVKRWRVAPARSTAASIPSATSRPAT